MVAYGGMTDTADSEAGTAGKTGAVTLISSQVTAPFSTYILIDGYDIPKPSGGPPRVVVADQVVRAPEAAGDDFSAPRRSTCSTTGEQNVRGSDADGRGVVRGGSR